MVNTIYIHSNYTPSLFIVYHELVFIPHQIQYPFPFSGNTDTQLIANWSNGAGDIWERRSTCHCHFKDKRPTRILGEPIRGSNGQNFNMFKEMLHVYSKQI